MANALYGEVYRNHGTSWIFGRRSVGRVVGIASGNSGGSKGGAKSSSRPSLSKKDIARLDRLTKGSPQVMVKVVSRTYTAAQLKQHIDYINREGDLDLETDYGVVRDKEEVEAIRDAWVEKIKSADHAAGSKRSAISSNLILSMPEGTDRAQFKHAVRDFVRSEFTDRHETMLAFHDDTDKPHAHIAVLNRDDRDKSLVISNERFDSWRESFAERLHDRGIEADASPRHARGVGKKSVSSREYWASKANGISQNYKKGLQEVVDERVGKRSVSADIREEKKTIRRNIDEKHTLVRLCYAHAVQELSQSDSPKERDIGERLRKFTLDMKEMPRTRDDEMRGIVDARIKDMEANKEKARVLPVQEDKVVEKIPDIARKKPDDERER